MLLVAGVWALLGLWVFLALFDVTGWWLAGCLCGCAVVGGWMGSSPSP